MTKRHHLEEGESQSRVILHEEMPLIRHISIMNDDNDLPESTNKLAWWKARLIKHWFCWWAVVVIIFAFCFRSARRSRTATPGHNNIIPITQAQEHLLDIEGGKKIWYRLWGNRNGIPLLFVHGGPGNAIADYYNGNSEFFDDGLFWVVEVDQRGTGNSQPSVRENCQNMKYYLDISIDQMSDDFERVRRALRIKKWAVFGGSWGSTLGLNYVQRYPHRCLGLMLRGIYLDTKPEFEAVFSRKSYLDNPKRLKEFDMWMELALQYVAERGERDLDPNDSERFFRIYGEMILNCDLPAIWRHFVFENNLMEEDPENLFDPYTINFDALPEAMSIAFFENRLFLRGTFDEPVDLLRRVYKLKGVNTWICQGELDEVCPPEYARKLFEALKEAGVPIHAKFLPNAGHEATDPVMGECLKQQVSEFLRAQSRHVW